MPVSVIIPTFNEESGIADLITYIRQCEGGSQCEVIVADAFSTDDTLAIASEAGARTIQVEKGRANQMNCGASIAKTDLLFFLHADTLPPPSFLGDITRANAEGYPAGCYRLSFDYDHWFLRFNCWFTKFDFTPFRFGDQGLYINKQLFRTISGYDSTLLLLEDQEIIQRIKREAKFRIFDKPVTTSARKYLMNGIFRLQFIFMLIYLLYRMGAPQKRLMQLYKRLIRDERIEPVASSWTALSKQPLARSQSARYGE